MQACIIWLHGLGADAENMMSVAEALPPTDIAFRHVFMDAPIRPVTLNNHMPMRAWYDVTGLKLTDREDRNGILHSEKMVQDVISSQIAEGLSANQIFIAGFSQGGALALFVGLRTTLRLGGVISLSAYLPLVSECNQTPIKSLPTFIAMGEHDPIVLPSWTRQSYDWLVDNQYENVTWKQYPMQHTICIEEIKDISCWLKKQVSLITCDGDLS